MDVVQVVASATQIVSSMIGVVAALEQASRDFEDAPKKIKSLEEFVCNLEELLRGVKRKNANKFPNSRLESQIQSLNDLIQRLHPKLAKARRAVSKNKVKKIAKVVWMSMVGDPLSKVVQSIRDDLNWWIEAQQLLQGVEKTMELAAVTTPSLLRIRSEPGYPVSNKCNHVKELLDQENSHRVILIVGLSGIGKSCLARQVASHPPSRFVDGALELRFGQWCSRAACNGSKTEYQKRLTKKICEFLARIGGGKKVYEETDGEMDNACFLLQEALNGKSYLILLDDVWEQDIVERFANLYDNDCRYLVTSRNEAIYEITEAEKVEICKDDIREISIEILLYHSLLTREKLPTIAEVLLERCGHHPLTVAVMGKALRKEIKEDKWQKAIDNLSMYATCWPGPVSYVNEKEAENTLTIFGSLEFSLEAMPCYSKSLFISLAVVSWEESVPEPCLEALWIALRHESMFALEVCKLVESSLLIKDDSCSTYHVHDMVALYLDTKVEDALKILLNDSPKEACASLAPWLFIFGKETIKTLAKQKIKFFLDDSDRKHVVITLESIVQALMASKSVSELEASSAGFSCILGPKVADLIALGSPEIIAATATSVMHVFRKSDYVEYHRSLECADAVDKFANLIEDTDEPQVQTTVSIVLAKMAEYGNDFTVNKVLARIPMNRLSDLLVPHTEEWHDNVFAALLSLIKSGNVKTADRMFSCGVDKRLIGLLENGSEVAQHHAIVILKSLYETGGATANHYLGQGSLARLPWHARLSLERYLLMDRHMSCSPKPQTFDDILGNLRNSDSKQIIEAMQDVVPIVEKANDLRIQDMILKSPLIEILASFLHHGNTEQNRISSGAAFVLMKMSCSGGKMCVRKVLEYNVIQDLVKMMQCNAEELQDAAYTILHQMLFDDGGTLVLNQIFETGQIERLVHALDSKSLKTKEITAQCLQDIVEIGNKVCIEKMLSVQVVEKLVNLETGSKYFSDAILRFLKGVDKCKNLSIAERRILKQQTVRKVRSAIKGHKLETQILGAVDGYVSEGSKGGSSSKHRRSSQ